MTAAGAFLCQEPSHPGNRVVAHPNDRFQKRIEYRRSDGNVRPHAKVIQNLCRDCMNTDWAGVQVAPSGVMARAMRLTQDTYLAHSPEQEAFL